MEKLAKKRQEQELKEIDKKRIPNQKNHQDNIDLLMMGQSKGKADTTPGKTPGELEDDRYGQDYMIMEVSEHTR